MIRLEFAQENCMDLSNLRVYRIERSGNGIKMDGADADLNRKKPWKS
jgi:hypothetical protein